jgi:protein-S-isoprenylcysteine O-methyltransferase Ste14
MTKYYAFPVDDATRMELFKQSNQAAIDFARNALSYLFLLNGAAAAALLAQGAFWFKMTACLFAMGALFSIFAFTLAYLHMKAAAYSWIMESRNEKYERNSLRIGLISVAFFIAGIIACFIVVIYE